MQNSFPLLTASRFKSATLGAFFIFCAMPCQIVAREKQTLVVRFPDETNPKKQTRRVSINLLRAKDAERIAAQSAFVRDRRENPEPGGKYFPTLEEIQKINPTY